MNAADRRNLMQDNSELSDDIYSFLPATAYASQDPENQALMARIEARMIKELRLQIADIEAANAELRREVAALRKAQPKVALQRPGKEQVAEFEAKLRLKDREIADLKSQVQYLLGRTLTDSEVLDRKELEALRSEIKDLREKEQSRIRAERAAERDRVKAEMQAQISGWRRMFECLEKLALQDLCILTEHEAESQDVRDLARALKSKPGELRAMISMDEISYQTAFEALVPLLHAATVKIGAVKKRGQPETRINHRARLLIETLDRRESLSSVSAIDIIAGDEGRVPRRWDVLRAMRRAEKLEPHKVEFFKSYSGGLPAQLRRKMVN